MAADAAPDKRAKRGERLGRFEVLAHIASGGMGAVYKAFDPVEKRVVALKVMSPQLVAKPNMIARFRREAMSAANLKHENIVALLEFGPVDDTFYIALEFIDGKDLHDYISQAPGGRLDPETARLFALQAARALDHAHRAGIIHRDIKPSNFLVVEGEGVPLVKLTDLGLARKEEDETEHRVTKAGMTLGTVDYMAPEQARDSGKADIRSDVYGLGCTLFHMLAGHPPFPKGTMAEKLVQHIQAEPPDICKINPAVPRSLALILKKMLAKRRRDRYQTPAELIADLEHPERVGRTPEPAPAPEDKPRTKPATPPPSGLSTVRKKGKKKRTPAWMPWAIGGGVVGFLALVLFIVLHSRRPPAEQKKTEEPKVVLQPVEPVKPPPAAKQIVGPPAAELKKLYVPILPLDPEALTREFYGPFGAFPEAPAGAPVIVVSRLPLQGTASVPSLAEALAKAPPGPAVIEIRDQGPHFLTSMPAVSQRDLWIRGGAGARPLLAWNGAGGSLLSVRQGKLVLDDLDIVVQASETGGGASCLFHVEGNEFQARGCTFSIAGKQPQGVLVVRLQKDFTGPATPGSKEDPAAVVKARLSRCFIRGEDVAILRTENTPADILLDGTLAIGGAQPLLQHHNADEDSLNVRLVHSTLAAQQQLWRWQSVGGKGGAPRLRGLAWDTILARTEAGANGGDMIQLADGAATNLLNFRPVNCLYAGWKRLLAAGDKNCASLDEWRSLCGHREGDLALAEPWPRARLGPLEEAPSASLEPQDSAAAFASLDGKAPLGCEVGLLPPVPALWQQHTYERFVGSAPPAPEADPADIASGADGLYHGESLDAGKVDLGQQLQARLQTLKPAARVVLRVSGKGAHFTSPLRFRGIEHIVIRFDQAVAAAKEKAEPLSLELKPGSGAGAALIDVEGGSLEIQNGRLRLPNSKVAVTPLHMIRVRGGDLRLQGCTLIGPLTKTPDSFQSLLAVEGAGLGALAPNNVTLRDCALHAGKPLIELKGTGARLVCRGCLLYALEEGVALDLGALATARPDVLALFDHNTIAVRQAFLNLHCQDAPAGCQPVVVQAQGNYFLDPSPDEPHQACLLRITGESLARGLLLWQGQGNVFARDRLHGYYAAGGAAPAKQAFADWMQLVGPLGETESIQVTAIAGKNFNLDQPAYERLQMPPSVRLEPMPGADLAKLGLIKKK